MVLHENRKTPMQRELEPNKINLFNLESKPGTKEENLIPQTFRCYAESLFMDKTQRVSTNGKLFFRI